MHTKNTGLGVGLMGSCRAEAESFLFRITNAPLSIWCSTLHGLLRKLGALDDLLPGASLAHSKLKTILAGLRAEGDESRQLEALSNLCELLSIATEESLSTFSVDSFVPLLV
eukprot:2892703-Pyramimonas_sp.AAC.2